MSTIEPPEKKGRGCFFYGCITSLVVLFVIAVVGLLAANYALKKVNGMIAEYTDTQPVVFPKVELPEDELRQLKDRVAAFKGAMDGHTNALPLVLTGPEINALLANSADFKQFKDKCYVEINDDQIKGQISLPLEKEFRIPLVHFKGRYLNGSGTFRVGVTNHTLSVYVQSLEVKGKPLPPEIMAQLQGKDMAADVNNNPTNAAVISRYDSVVVKDGKITLKAKGD